MSSWKHITELAIKTKYQLIHTHTKMKPDYHYYKSIIRTQTTTTVLLRM